MDNHLLDDIAAQALWPLRGERIEHIGLLYDDGGTIRATDTAAGRRASARGTFGIPAGSLVGIFHNHPLSGRAKKDAQRRQFSPDDVQNAERLGVPSYIIAGGMLRRYDPGTPHAGLAYSNVPGKDVLAEIPIDVIRAELMARLGRAPDDPRGPYLETPPTGLLSAAGPGLLSD